MSPIVTQTQRIRSCVCPWRRKAPRKNFLSSQRHRYTECYKSRCFLLSPRPSSFVLVSSSRLVYDRPSLFSSSCHFLSRRRLVIASACQILIGTSHNNTYRSIRTSLVLRAMFHKIHASIPKARRATRTPSNVCRCRVRAPFVVSTLTVR